MGRDIKGEIVEAVAEDDSVTVQLTRVLLVCEIASQVLACFMFAQMIPGANLEWRVQRMKKKVEGYARRRHEWRLSVGRMLYTAEEVLADAGH